MNLINETKKVLNRQAEIDKKEFEVYKAVNDSRSEPVLSLERVAKAIRESLSEQEREQLSKLIKKG